VISLARFSIRRPNVSLAAWLVVAVALSVIGLGVAGTLSPSITVVPGTQSSRAEQLASAQFGPTQLVPILIEGPKQNSTVRARGWSPRSRRVHRRASFPRGTLAPRARGYAPSRPPR